MKMLLVLLSFVLFTTVSKADSPTPPWFEAIAPNVFLSDATSAQEGNFVQKTARFIYDVATDGGATGAHALGVYLPAKAVITRSYFKIITQFSDSGSGTVALSCEDANNIKTATDITGSSANAFIEGASTGAASEFVRGIAANCNITATVAGVTQDAGKLVGWVTYVLEN